MHQDEEWPGLWCERCEQNKPDVKFARDVWKDLCGLCWVDTAPETGVPRSGFLTDDPPQTESDEESSDA